eukprot:m.80100 g.80100  ORF g.80100 m.80100 type:complete len:337 (+) comp12003_c0_seq1:229-1239(+)
MNHYHQLQQRDDDVFEDESLLSHPKIMISSKTTSCRKPSSSSLPKPIALPDPPSERCRAMRTHVTDVMERLFVLPLGAPCPFSYAKTFGKVFDCVCGGKGPNLLRLLKHLTNKRCREINEGVYERIDVPFDQFLVHFYNFGVQFKQACKISAALFNYLEREYVEKECDTTLSSEMMDILHDFTMGDESIKEKLLLSLQEASKHSLAVDPMVMMCITETLYMWDPSYLKHIPEVVKRFIPATERKRQCDPTTSFRAMYNELDTLSKQTCKDKMTKLSTFKNTQATGPIHHRPFFPNSAGKRDLSDDEDEDDDDEYDEMESSSYRMNESSSKHGLLNL